MVFYQFQLPAHTPTQRVVVVFPLPRVRQGYHSRLQAVAGVLVIHPRTQYTRCGGGDACRTAAYLGYFPTDTVHRFVGQKILARDVVGLLLIGVETAQVKTQLHLF